MSSGFNLHLPDESRECLNLVNRQLGLPTALGLFAYLVGEQPEFPATLCSFEREKINSLAETAGAQIQV